MAEYKKKSILKEESYLESDKLQDSSSPQLKCDRFLLELQHPSIKDRVEKKGRKGAGLEKYNN